LSMSAMQSGLRGQGTGFRVNPNAAIDFSHAILQPVQRLSGLLTPMSKNGQKRRGYRANSIGEVNCRLRAGTALKGRNLDSGFRKIISSKVQAARTLWKKILP